MCAVYVYISIDLRSRIWCTGRKAKEKAAGWSVEEQEEEVKGRATTGNRATTIDVIDFGLKDDCTGKILSTLYNLPIKGCVRISLCICECIYRVRRPKAKAFRPIYTYG